MTTPQAGMPYGVTLNPSGMQGTFLTFENIPAAHRVGTSGLKLPAGVSIIRVVSKLAAAVRMQYIYNDGSPLNQFEIIPSGGGVLRNRVGRKRVLRAVYLNWANSRPRCREARNGSNHPDSESYLAAVV